MLVPVSYSWCFDIRVRQLTALGQFSLLMFSSLTLVLSCLARRYRIGFLLVCLQVKHLIGVRGFGKEYKPYFHLSLFVRRWGSCSRPA